MTTKSAPARRPIKDDGNVGAGTPIWDEEFADRWRALHEHEDEQPQRPRPAPRRGPRRPAKKDH